MPDPTTLPERVAAQAQSIVDTLKQTDYQHPEHIDTDHGIYDCDCGGFVGLVLDRIAPQHYAAIPREPAQPRPRAFEYYDFFASLDTRPNGGWTRIDLFRDVRRGDIVAWRFPTIEKHHDTGHVLIAAAIPEQCTDDTFLLGEYDSAVVPHFDDTRGDDPGQFPTGVGHGHITFRVDGDGRPVAFLFSPSEDRYTALPIAVGRLRELPTTATTGQ